MLSCLLIPMVGCASAPETEIPTGRFSGSTSADVGITIDVAGSQIRVQNTRTRLVRVDDNRKFVAERLPGKPRFSCEPVLEGEELRCEVRWPDRTETVEFMRE